MNARTPTSTRTPPFTTSSTVPPMVFFSANAASRRAPVARRLHLNGRELIVALLVAAANRDQQLGAGLQIHRGIERQHAVHLAADIDEDGVGGDRHDGAFDGLAARRDAFVRIGKGCRRRSCRSRTSRANQKCWIGACGKTGILYCVTLKSGKLRRPRRRPRPRSTACR